MPIWVMPLYFMLLLSGFMLYGRAVRSNRLEGKAVIWVGGGIGLVGVIASYLILTAASGPKGLPPQTAVANALMLAMATAFVIFQSYRLQQVDEVRSIQVGGATVSVRVCQAFRIMDLDTLIVPTSTKLASLDGPSASLVAAAGPEVETATRKQSPAPLDKVVATGAGQLRGVGSLLHAVVHEPLRPVDAGRLRRGVDTAAQQARKSGARRVGVVLGPMRGLSHKDAAEAVAPALLKHLKSFEQIVFVGLDARTGAALQAALPQGEPKPSTREAGA